MSLGWAAVLYLSSRGCDRAPTLGAPPPVSTSGAGACRPALTRRRGCSPNVSSMNACTAPVASSLRRERSVSETSRRNQHRVDPPRVCRAHPGITKPRRFDRPPKRSPRDLRAVDSNNDHATAHGRSQGDADCSWKTSTVQDAWCATRSLTLPRARTPWTPREPTTTRSASRDRSRSA
jgi:hypothetical protein